MISLLRHVKEVVKPRACVICQHRLAPTEHAVCTTCNRHLPRTYYAGEARDNPVCRLFWKQVPIERGASWVVYAERMVSQSTSVSGRGIRTWGLTT